jgi:hypothetical protein
MLASDREERPRTYKELDERLQELMDLVGSSPQRPAGFRPPDGDATMVGGGPMLSRPTKKPTATAPAVPKPTQPPNAAPTGPGLLRTAEIDFLAGGMEAGAANAPPAFRDGSSGIVTPPVAPASPPPPPAPQAAAPAPRARGSVLVVGVMLVLGGAVGTWLALQPSGKEGGDDGKGAQIDPVVPPLPQPQPPQPKPLPVRNQPPVPEGIDGVAEPRPLGRTFTLEAKFRDPDGDKAMVVWTVPEEIKLLGGTDARNQTKVKLRIEDGLPGEEYPIEVEANDGKNPAVKMSAKVIVGDVPFEPALEGFKTSPRWSIDNNNFSWGLDGDGYAFCNAKDQLRTMSTSPGTDAFWQWTGALVAEELKDTAPAKVGVRLELGDVGYTVRCSRTGPGDDASWTIDLLDARREGGVWKEQPMAPPRHHEFAQVDPDTGDARGWFSVTRRRDRLIVEIGSTLLQRTDAGEGQDVPQPLSTFEVPIADANAEPTITLSVDQGRGKFRIRRR